MSHSVRGAALIDLVFTCGLIATLAGIAIPAVHATRDRDAARMAARYLADRLHAIRVDALRRNVTVAIRFDPTEVGRFGPYADGDGDGVLQGDIDRGTDHSLAPEARLADFFQNVSFRIRQDVPDPDGSGTLPADSDPVRIGSSNLLSFSPLGSATSGTLYLSGESGPQMAVRVLGSTGRVRVLSFDVASRQWRAD
jgi:Tfp pilus assembly protein FimT